MTPAARRALARVLGALLPWRTIGRLMDDPCKAHAAAARRETACMTAGVEEREAVMRAESLAGYVLGWGGRYATWTSGPARAPRSSTWRWVVRGMTRCNWCRRVRHDAAARGRDALLAGA